MRGIGRPEESRPAGAFRVRIWGARGSLPVSGEQFCVFGGNTMCIEIRCGDHVLLFDAGSGLLPAGQALKTEGVDTFNLFFSHCHYDHIIGLPFFSLMFDPTAVGTFWSGHLEGKMTTDQMISSFMRPPWFPVEPDIWRARLISEDFRAGDVLRPHADLIVRTASLNHPGGAIGYRVEWAGRAAAIITDTEHLPGVLDPAVQGLIEGCDLFLYDTTYTDEEMEAHRGFGHSSWQHAIVLAKNAGARQVGFVHHAPWRSDAALLEADRLAKKEFSGAFFARDGQIIDL